MRFGFRRSYWTLVLGCSVVRLSLGNAHPIADSTRILMQAMAGGTIGSVAAPSNRERASEFPVCGAGFFQKETEQQREKDAVEQRGEARLVMR